MKNYIDIKKLVTYIPLTKSTIYTMVNKGQIPYKKIRHKLIFDVEEIDQWIDNGGKIVKEVDIPEFLQSKK